MKTNLPVSYFQMSSEDLPFTIEIFDASTHALLWTRTVTSAGAMRIPGQGTPCYVTMHLSDGSTYSVDAHGNHFTPPVPEQRGEQE